MKTAAAHRPQQARQIWLAWLCALCLLGFQGVGHWHRIAHAGGVSSIGNSIGTSTIGSVEKTAVWGHQSGDADCKLFDQLSHELGPGSTSAVVGAASVQLATADTVSIRIDTAALWKRGARGPPIFA